MGRKIYGIFMAGGSGHRMGADIPKQFIELDGIPVLQLTVEKFLSVCPDMDVTVVLPEEHFGTWNDLCGEFHLDCKQRLVGGGITRFHSVKNALEKIPDGVTVMIHDGVRPLVSGELIRKMMEKSGTCRGLIPVIPVTDTLKSLDLDREGNLSPSSLPDPDRSGLFAAQTPQVFCSEDIKEAYESEAYDVSFTDDASVARRHGIPLSYILGEKTNIKLTTPEDLILARALKSLL